MNGFTAGAAAAETRQQVISFGLENELMGIGLHFVDKVIEPVDFTFVPRCPSFIKGVINHHGKIIAVVDMKEFMGMGDTEIGLDTRILILASDVFHLGLMVDRVERIESVPLSGHLVQKPESGEAGPYVVKLINLGGKILNLLDLDKLMREIENFFE